MNFPIPVMCAFVIVQVDSIPSKDGSLQSAALLRKEREREKILDDQKAAQRNQVLLKFCFTKL